MCHVLARLLNIKFIEPDLFSFYIRTIIIVSVSNFLYFNRVLKTIRAVRKTNVCHILQRKQKRSTFHYFKYICRQDRYIVFLHLHLRPAFACCFAISHECLCTYTGRNYQPLAGIS